MFYFTRNFKRQKLRLQKAKKIYNADTDVNANADANAKIFNWHSSLVPEEIRPCQQASMVYDNIDHLEKTQSDDRTTHRLKIIDIQKTLIRLKLPQYFI